MAFFSRGQQIITLCLLVLLVAFIGHFLVDATGLLHDVHDVAVTLELHGNFLLTNLAELPVLLALVFISLRLSARVHHLNTPPTPPRFLI